MCSYRKALRLCPSVLRSFTFGLASLPECFAFVHVWLCGVFRGESVGAKCGSRTAVGRASRVAARSLLCAQTFESGRVKWKRHSRRPKLRQGDSSPWTLFILFAMWVRFTRRGPLRDNEDLTGSNKRRPHCGWPGKSRSCIIVPIRQSFKSSRVKRKPPHS